MCRWTRRRCGFFGSSHALLHGARATSFSRVVVLVQGSTPRTPVCDDRRHHAAASEYRKASTPARSDASPPPGAGLPFAISRPLDRRTYSRSHGIRIVCVLARNWNSLVSQSTRPDERIAEHTARLLTASRVRKRRCLTNA